MLRCDSCTKMRAIGLAALVLASFSLSFSSQWASTSEQDGDPPYSGTRRYSTVGALREGNVAR